MTGAMLAPVIAVVIYIIVSIIYHLKSVIAIAIALGILIASAIALTFGKADIAQELAIYFYYFLIAGFVLLIVHKFESNEGNDTGGKQSER